MDQTDGDRPGEEWRQVVGHPGYAVSDQGRIRRTAGTPKHPPGTLLTLQWAPTARGEPVARVVVQFLRKRGASQLTVAKVMLQAFGVPVRTYERVAPLDGNWRNLALTNWKVAPRPQKTQPAARVQITLGGSRPAPATPKSARPVICEPVGYAPDDLDARYVVEMDGKRGWTSHRWEVSIARVDGVVVDHHRCQRCEAQRDVPRDAVIGKNWRQTNNSIPGIGVGQ